MRSADEYYTSLMEIAAPVQNLMAKLTDAQKQDVKQRILQAASNYIRGGRIIFPMAVRIVAAANRSEPSHGDEARRLQGFRAGPVG